MQNKNGSIIKPAHPIDPSWGWNWVQEMENFQEAWRNGLTVCPYCRHPLPPFVEDSNVQH